MIKYDKEKYDKEKFLVINMQRFEDLYKAMIKGAIDQTVFSDLGKAIQKFSAAYKELVGDGKLDYNYYVVKTDEPYAEKVWALIADEKAPEHRVYRDELMNLLAVIHRDGGHYVAKHGVSMAVIDAIKVIYQDRQSAAM